MNNNNIKLGLIELGSSGIFSSFMGLEQRSLLCASVTSDIPESQEIADKLVELAARIRSMPNSYETNFVDTPDKVLQLRYFKGPITAWIIEKDIGSESENEQHQAFGYVDLFGYGIKDADLGYISIAEYIENGMFLDIDFVPITRKELIEQQKLKNQG